MKARQLAGHRPRNAGCLSVRPALSPPAPRVGSALGGFPRAALVVRGAVADRLKRLRAEWAEAIAVSADRPHGPTTYAHSERGDARHSRAYAWLPRDRLRGQRGLLVANRLPLPRLARAGDGGRDTTQPRTHGPRDHPGRRTASPTTVEMGKASEPCRRPVVAGRGHRPGSRPCPTGCTRHLSAAPPAVMRGIPGSTETQPASARSGW